MCTVSVVPAFSASHNGLIARLVCNRDEQRSRAPSLPPIRQTTGTHLALMPIDPPSGGTWIGANDAGLLACLLNASPSPGSTRFTNRLSRGEIVPQILASSDILQAASTAARLNPDDFPPFRLLLLSTDGFAVVASDGHSLATTNIAALRAPIMLTSSGLGDALVDRPRQELFDHLLGDLADPLDAQARFHRHAWPDQPHLSVLMSRQDARTVSRTVIDLRAGSILLRHERLSNSLAPEALPSSKTLPLSPTRVAA